MPTEKRSSNAGAPFKCEDRCIVIKRIDLQKVPVNYRSAFVKPMFSLHSHLPRRECLVIESFAVVGRKLKEAVAAGDQMLAGRISQFQFRDIRPKAASEITDIDQASLLLGHTKGDITERVYRRVGALAKPTK